MLEHLEKSLSKQQQKQYQQPPPPQQTAKTANPGDETNLTPGGATLDYLTCLIFNKKSARYDKKK